MLKKPKTAKCKNCGKEFIVNQAHRKFCSQTCFVEFYSQPQVKPKVKRICKNCGQEFWGHGNSLYCSVECHLGAIELREAAKKAENRLKRQNMPQVACLWCKGWFFLKPRINLQFYCCHECGELYNAMRHQIYQQFTFDSERLNAELAKLREQGKNYKLPEREV